MSTINAVCPGDHQHESWGLVQQGSKRVFATSLEVHYPKALCEAIAHAFILKLVAMGMFFHEQPSLQQAARTSTLQQVPSAKIPPLVSNFKSRLVAFYKQEHLVWPLTFIDTEACKIPHRFQMGDVVSVQNLRQNQGVLDRLTSEFDAWSLSFDLQALSVNFQFEFDAVKIL